MIIDNPPYSVDYIKASTGEILHPMLIDIGAWNMDTTPSISIAHGMGANWNKIRSIDVFIYHDLGTIFYPLNMFVNGVDPALLAGGVLYVDNTNIQLERRSGGQFDHAFFSSILINRGHIIAWYRD